ncbi:Protein SIX6OS1, partial [Lonchura striata]
MSDDVSTNLDKILVKLDILFHGFVENALIYFKIYFLISVCTAKIAEKKNQIAWLEENIKKGNEALADLQKQNESSKKLCDAWKPTYTILKEHGEYLKTEMKVLEEATESERKIYEDFITQCRMTLEEQRKKYTETALAQKYYQKKEEVEEIQKRVLKRLEKYKWKEDACLDILEAVPFTSINDWAVHIASMRKKTQETLQLAEAAAQETIKLEKEAEELKTKIDCLKEGEEKKRKQRNFQWPPAVPPVLQKIYHRCVALPLIIIDTAGTNRPQITQVPSIVSIKKQEKFRLSDLPKQLTSNQQFESENEVMASQEAKHDDEEAHEHMDCSFIPQDVHTGFKPNEDNPDTEEDSAEPFLRAPKTPDLKGKNPHFSKTFIFDSIQNLGCEEGTSKSPAFFSHMNFSQKSPGFNLFGSSLFGAQNSSDEVKMINCEYYISTKQNTEENYSVANLNSLSPHEDI